MPEFALLSAIAEEQEKCKESTTKADIMDRLRRLKIPTQMREVGTKSQPGSMRSPTKRRRSISTMAGVSLPSSLIIPVEKQGRRRSSVSSVVDDSILRSPTTPKEEKGQKQKRNSIFIRNEWLKERKQLWAPVPKWISY